MSSLLELLLPELMLEVIDNTQESVFALRLTSQTLRTRVDDFILFDWKRLERSKESHVIKELSIKKECHEKNRSATSFCLIVPENMSKHLNLRILIRSPFNVTTCIKKDKADENMVYSWSFVWSYSPMHYHLLYHLIRCVIEQKIESVTMPFDEQLPKLFEEGSQIEKLNLTFHSLNDDSAGKLLKMVVESRATHLSLTISSVLCNSGPAKLLLDLSSTLRALRIEQIVSVDFLSFVGSAPKKNYLFGLLDANWGSIILAMFSKNLDKLWIENEKYRGFFTHADFDLLKEELPKLGKKVWFETSHNLPADVDSFTSMGHLAQIVPSYKSSSPVENGRTSKTLRARVDDFILFDWKRIDRSQKSHVIKELSIAKRCHEEFRSTTDFSLIVPENMSEHLNLRFLVHSPLNLADCIKRDKTVESVIYSWSFVYSPMLDHLLYHLISCVSEQKIETVTMPFDEQLPKLFEEGPKIEKLILTLHSLNDDSAGKLLKMVVESGVAHLSLKISSVMCTSGPVKLLLDLSSTLRTLRIEQIASLDCISFDGNAPKKNYLFGLSDVNWGSIILAMFSKKLDKLWIENEKYRGYFTQADYDLLKKELPKLGKKIWFETSHNLPQDIAGFTSLRHFAQILPPYKSAFPLNDGKVIIKHTSRLKEDFWASF